MASKYGFSSINKQLGVKSNSNSSPAGGAVSPVISARVTDIILNDEHPSFSELGGYSSIGTIFYEMVEGASTTTPGGNTAPPILPYMKNYPLVNELVLLFLVPSNKVGNQSNNKSYFYLNPISIWNNQHMNGYPNLLDSTSTQATENKSYQQIEEGQTRKSTDETVDYSFNSPTTGGTFVERSNIHPLLAFAGDIIIEGRWSNSIRFGSTAKTDSLLFGNNWSNSGENGDPITILRNGQPTDVVDNGFIPIVEDINKDLSSLYLTSKQTIPLISPITSFPAFTTPPESITSFAGSQVILNSDRLLFNTKADSIIFNSSQHISISSVQSVGMYSKEGDITIQPSKGKVKLGDINASQSVILGDNFIDDFQNLLNKLNLLMTSLSAEPLLFLSSGTAASVKTQISLMLINLKNYKSKIVKAI
jgi:hypothetical protein